MKRQRNLLSKAYAASEFQHRIEQIYSVFQGDLNLMKIINTQQ